MHPIDSFKISALHPCLPGHFPDHPIVPGVVLLEQVELMLKQSLTNWEITELIQVKFLQPVLPEEFVELLIDSRRLEIHQTIVFQLNHIENQSCVVTGKLKMIEVNKG
jgi:3-hydroxymyristoyl/3-hydroxydecanoyl-(acyl carrier protein) dehydratase